VEPERFAQARHLIGFFSLWGVVRLGGTLSLVGKRVSSQRMQLGSVSHLIIFRSALVKSKEVIVNQNE